MNGTSANALPLPADRDDPAAPAILLIDLGALRDNYLKLAALAPASECAAVVKADGYGTGAVKIASTLAQAGCRTFFVATLGEARELRAAGREEVIYVLDGLFPRTSPLFAEAQARPVLGSLEEIREWAEFCRKNGKRMPAALHVDTGMNRLGLRENDVNALAASLDLLEAFQPSLIISHLACADEPEDPMNRQQKEAFDRLRAKLPPIPAGLANSGGVFLGSDFHYDMVRPGIALYGARAVNERPNPMLPVVSLYGRIAQVRIAERGESVGYGAARRLSARTRIATVMTGYADGIFRRLSAPDGEEGLVVYLGDEPAPVLGRISMDSMMIDVTGFDDDAAARGGLVEIIGPHVSVDEIAERAGTIGYEVLTSLGQRYKRIYLDAKAGAG
ncbi:MAG: alanine racemase [Methyloligellaceae bacterium]